MCTNPCDARTACKSSSWGGVNLNLLADFLVKMAKKKRWRKELLQPLIWGGCCARQHCPLSWCWISLRSYRLFHRGVMDVCCIKAATYREAWKHTLTLPVGAVLFFFLFLWLSICVTEQQVLPEGDAPFINVKRSHWQRLGHGGQRSTGHWRTSRGN